ncbi:MAG TPA: winged helix DNA-binding protein [Solirubrobacteraceae bacterium]|jgi:DNA-binding MarR family transcriptional regulator
MDPLFEFALTVKAIQRELERRTNEAMAPLGLTGAQADALIVIGQAEPLALKDLGGLLIAEGGHPSRLVDRLVAAKLVKRHIPRDDRRSVQLSLTAAGHKLEQQVNAARAGVFDLARTLIGERDLGPGLDLLRDLAQHTAYGELIARRRTLSESGSERA